MKQYEKYKSTGIDQVGEIPSHWDLRKLKYLAKILNGQDHKNVWDENGKYPIIGTGGEFGKANQYLHTGPSVILGRKGTIDKPQFWDTPFWAVDTAYYTNIPAYTNPRFFFYCCKTILFDLYKYGSAVPSMTQETLNQIQFATPPLTEQSSIANFLDEKTGEIDKLISNKQKLIELLKEERTSIINEAVSGKGKNWERKKLKYVAEINSETLSEKENENLLIHYIDISSVDENGKINSTSEYLYSDAPSRARRIVRDGDTILSTVRTYLKAIAFIQNATENLICSTGFAVIRPNEKLNEKFLFLVCRSQKFIDEIMSSSKGVSYPSVDSEDVKNIEVNFPPLKEQTAIVQHIQTETQRIDNTISKVAKEIELMQEYRTVLISEAVTGKIKVT